ncbi:unnamed protein product, partial [Bubo scandiacus]
MIFKVFSNLADSVILRRRGKAEGAPRALPPRPPLAAAQGGEAGERGTGRVARPGRRRRAVLPPPAAVRAGGRR